MVKGEDRGHTTLYGELALDAAGRNNRAEAMSWLASRARVRAATETVGP